MSNKLGPVLYVSSPWKWKTQSLSLYLSKCQSLINIFVIFLALIEYDCKRFSSSLLRFGILSLFFVSFLFSKISDSSLFDYKFNILLLNLQNWVLNTWLIFITIYISLPFDIYPDTNIFVAKETFNKIKPYIRNHTGWEYENDGHSYHW